MAPTVVVLGAGASHGAAVPREARLECLPPLNACLDRDRDGLNGMPRPCIAQPLGGAM
jgi:hypothetical protein